MKPRKWPRILGLVAIILIEAYAAGAASAYRAESGDGLPFTLVTTLGAAVGFGLALWLVLPLFGPRKVGVAELPTGIQFTISPLIPFVDALGAVRWELGDESPLPRFGGFSRPLVSINGTGVTIWKAAGDAHPLVSIPASAVRSVSCDEQKVQVSRTGLKGTFVCITLDLMIGTTAISLILPACTEVNRTNAAPREIVDAWAALMQGELRS